MDLIPTVDELWMDDEDREKIHRQLVQWAAEPGLPVWLCLYTGDTGADMLTVVHPECPDDWRMN